MNWIENLFVSESEKKKIEEINAYLKEENYDKALFELEILTASKSFFVDLNAMKALCLIKKQDYDKAIHILEKVFEVEKEHKEGIYAMGLIYKDLEDYDKALAQFRKALNYGYNKPDIYNDMASIYIEQKEPDKAITQLKIALSKESRYIPTYKKLVNILIQQENYLLAIDYCNQALAVKKDLQLTQDLITCYNKLGDLEKALILAETLPQNYFSSDNYTNLVTLYLKKGDYNTALEKLNSGLELYPNDLGLKIKKLEVLYYLGKFNALLAFSDTILNKNLTDPKLLCFIGIGNYYANFKEKAQSYFEKSLNIEKNYLNTYYFACCLLENKAYEKAESFFTEALSYSSENNEKAKVYEKLYNLYNELKNYDKALEVTKKGLELADEPEKIKFKEFIKEINKNLFELEKKHDNKHKNYYIKNNYELYDWIKKIKFFLKKYPKFEPWEAKIDEIIYELSQPLNVAVMGEFKAGKSTFINALMGKELALMGVTPTTATLNFFKYGDENKIRIFKEDNSYEDSDIQSLAKYVDERVLNKETIEDISYIEILYNWDKLKDINVIDTPGLNAGIKRHEDLTQDFIKKADIVIWIFDVEQAGKQSEKKILDKIKALSKNLIAVINGIDKVDDKDEIFEVVDYLKNSLGLYFDEILPVSAKKALYSKLNSDNYDESGFVELEKYLEENIYSKTAKIKIDSIIFKIKELFAEVISVIQDVKIEYQSNISILEKLKEEVLIFEKTIDSLAFTSETKLKTDFDEIIKKLTKEIKRVIRPTQGIIESVFGKNKIENQEKSFILESLKKEVKQSFDLYTEIFKRYFEEKAAIFINKIISNLSFIEKDENNNKVLAFLDTYNKQKIEHIYKDMIYPNYRYYQGFLDAGTIDRFFNQMANELDLSEENIYKILLNYLPNIFDNLTQDFKTWKLEYSSFLNEFFDNLTKNLKDEFFELNNNIFDQLIILNGLNSQV